MELMRAQPERLSGKYQCSTVNQCARLIHLPNYTVIVPQQADNYNISNVLFSHSL